jgi:hypothetical protein
VATAEGHLVLTGRALMPVMMLSALVNQGRYGYASCDSDPDSKLPDFRLTCPLAASDSHARIVETKTASQLAPRFFESFGKPGGQDAAEVIMLGLMAGWDVEREAIRTAGFTSGAAGPTRDASDWLSAVMSDPSGRAACSSPRRACYSFFEAGDDEAFERAFLDKLRAARAAQGLTPPVLITTLDGDAAAVAAGLREGRATPHESLQALAKTGVEVLGRPVQCFVVEASDLSALPVPDELLAPGNLEVSVTVTHYQPDDGAWGRFAVLVLVPGEAPRA